MTAPRGVLCDFLTKATLTEVNNCQSGFYCLFVILLK